MTKPLALVTGGSRGIGRGVVRRLAQECRVAFTYRREADAAHDLIDTVSAEGGHAYGLRTDLAQAGEATRVVEEVIEDHGPLSAVVGNAGAASRGHSAVDSEDGEYTRLFQLHALSNVELVRAALPSLRETGGSVVFVSSALAKSLPPGSAPYAAAKAALEAIAVVLAREERAHKVRVNLVASGLVATDMGDRLTQATVGGSGTEALDAAAPFGRVCQPADVADAVAFLTSTAASYITGHRLAIDGGGVAEPLVPTPRELENSND